jgi:hypothetical protein
MMMEAQAIVARHHQQANDDDSCAAGTTSSSNGHHHHHYNYDALASSTTKKDNDDTTAETAAAVTVTRRANSASSTSSYPSFVRSGLYEEMVKQVVRKKLAKQRHLVLTKAIDATLLDSLFQQMQMQNLFTPQTVVYNGGVANVPEWKISCYLEVMNGGIPTTQPNVALLQLYQPLLDAINVIFMDWYRQQHACNNNNDANDPPSRRYSSGKCTTTTSHADDKKKTTTTCRRLMTFITRYTPRPGEEALLKVRIG